MVALTRNRWVKATATRSASVSPVTESRVPMPPGAAAKVAVVGSKRNSLTSKKAAAAQASICVAFTIRATPAS